ncbi:sugar phosphate isomerase/epimerase [Paenibacillus sp. LHD-38]|uniref:sugar phosphate isomerase/epimerase family protein n=1 Tax=Paenibacillus sp. LHD-38 TaxID=3072143 RepID=UPI00280C9F63|nr:sugar phosphate isomerase/epimerase [Paenibacillus sp. LHD-38]MDQ8734722.1 sugar phosphate isomerase/epimerase [Paenibacillus sp. LHD-38]
MRNKFAAQLYTLREQCKKDFYGTLRILKEMGWRSVQIDGLHGYPAEEIATVLKETGLSVAGMHVSLTRMNTELDVVLKEAESFGTPYFYCHYLPSEMQDEAGYRQAKRELLEVAGKVRGLGYHVGYHNHDFEFHIEIDGKVALDYLLATEDGYSLLPEIDTYWVKKAGRDPLTYISQYAGRKFPILHLKDMTNDDRQYFAEVGTGSIDFGPIIQWGEANGVEYYAVEQDYCPGNPFDSLALSLEHLRKLVSGASK